MEKIAGKYDVIVIGAGHAGVEAGLAAARLGAKTLMFSINLDSVAMMPCNPSIGGTGKGPARVIWFERLMHWVERWESTLTSL